MASRILMICGGESWKLISAKKARASKWQPDFG